MAARRNVRKHLRILALAGWPAFLGIRSAAADQQVQLDFVHQVDAAVVQQLRRAWIRAHAGTVAREEVVTLAKTADGTYQSAVQPYSNLHVRGRFALGREIVAVFHTHPSSVDPRPSVADRELADRTCIPVATMTSLGFFVYDPVSGVTVQLLERLDWLDVSAWRSLTMSR